MTTTTAQFNQEAFNTFKKNNQSFNLENFNFSDEDAVKKLFESEEDRETLLPQLKALQRLICITPDENHAIALFKKGLHSCFQIAAMSKQQFIDDYASAFGDDEKLAVQAYQRALARASRLTLHYMNLKDASSPHYHALRANNLSRQTNAQNRSLPSYEQLFGGLDFCEVEECRSIFSPAAYLVDLIRFKENYIDDSQVDNNYKLESRRPDLASIVLNCENTNTPIPQLDIVNKILEGRIYQTLKPSTLYNPKIFLPFNGNTDDQSEGKHQITLTGNAEFVEGRLGGNNAFKFDGNNYLTTDKLTMGSKYTFVAWVKVSSDVEGHIIKKPLKGLHLSILSDGTLQFVDDSEKFQLSHPHKLNWNVWYHVAITRHEKSAVLYVDGKKVTGADDCKDSINNEELLIGEKFKGILDEISIYSRTLDDEEIVALAKQDPKDQIYSQLVQQNCPFNLPFHLPLEQIRTNLNQLKTSLPDIWRTFSDQTPNLRPAEVDPVNQESLGLSPDEQNLYTTLNAEPSQIKEMFGITATDVNPNNVINSLVNISDFLEKTGLTREELNELLFGDLSQQEITQKLNKFFFINAGADEPIGTAQNQLTNLSLPKLDRIHRFIRLAKKIGFSFTDLDWALRTANPDNPEIDNNAIQCLAQLKEWQKTYNLSIVELCSFIGKVKDFGKKSGQSFCDRIFNSLNVQNQPALPNESIEWTLTGKDADNADNRKIKARLAGSLGISENELVAIASKVLTAQNLSDGKLPLSIESLSALYRLSKISQVLGMSVSDTLDLLKVLGDSELNNIVDQPTIQAIDTFNKLADLHQWLQTEGISIDELTCILTGQAPPSSPLYVSNPKAINFINDLWGDVQNVLVNHTTLQSNSELHVKDSQNNPIDFLELFQKTGWIDLSGLVLNIPTVTDIDTELQNILQQAANKSQQLKSTIISVLTNHQQLQQKILDGHLGNFFNIFHDALPEIKEWADSELGNDVFLLKELLQPILSKNVQLTETDEIPAPVKKALDALNRYACLTKVLKLTGSELQSIIAHCNIYNINDITKLTLADVRSLSQFKQLVNIFQDRNNELIACLVSANVEKLSKLTQWDASQIELLLQAFERTQPNTFTVAEVTRLKTCFDLSQKTGLMMNSLLELFNQLQGATDYNDFAREADSLLAAVKAKYSDTEWATVYEPIHATLNEKKRDALVGYVIYKLQQDGVDVKTPRDLYEYLLIDVEVSGIVKTSLIKEALDCLQLYIYRCQMQLEQAKLKDEGEQYWSWMKNYRVWEANRKTFLYPENYIRPELRKEKTPLFTQLEQALQQTHISEESVDNAVKTYLDSFAEVANLKTAGSYLYETDDPNGAQHPQKNLYLLGRTHTQPYQYYYRTATFHYDSNNGIYEPIDWSPWVKIELNIPATYPSPVYAFHKLFIFWVEIKPAPSDRKKPAPSDEKESNGGSGVEEVTKKRFEATVRYSFYNFNKSWVSPQTLGEPILLPKEVDSKEKAEEYEWQKVFTLAVGDQILIAFYNFYTVIENDLKQQYEILKDEVHTGCKLSTEHLGFNQLPKGAKNYPVLHQIPTPVAYYPLSYNNKNIFAKGNIVFSDIEGISEFNTIFEHPCCKGELLVTINSPLESDYTISCWVQTNDAFNVNYWASIIASVNTDDTRIFSLDVAKGILSWNENNSGFLKLDQNFGEKWHHFLITVQKHEEQWKYDVYLDRESKHSENLESGLSLSRLRLSWASGERQLDAYFSNLMIFDELLNTNDIKILNWMQTIPIQVSALLEDETVCNSWSILDTSKSEYLAIPQESNSTTYQYIRLNSTTIHDFSRLLFAEGIDGLLSIKAQEIKEDSFSVLDPDDNIIPNPDPPSKPQWPSDNLDFNGANSLYYWELFFHTPFLVANSFNTAQQFELAQKWYHYIFNPTTRKDNSSDRYWRFLGLRNIRIPTLKEELTNNGQIAKYYEDPFDPHAIAQLRPIAYQKTIVMRYIDNLLDWGDWLFRQDTPETLIEATLLYVTAYDLLGKKPADLGACSLPEPVTLGTIPYNPQGDVPEFLIILEQSSQNTPPTSARDNPNNYIPNAYFGIPENEQFTQYWNRVIGRLYNIRHNLNIDGIPQNLPLFAPPIDPEQLIQAVASGAGISSAIAGNQVPIPHYRFAVMIEKAKSATATVIQFGAALLSALEKKDAEQLTALNTTHEQALLTASRAIKQDQLQAAQAAVLALQDGITGAQTRLAHYNKLINQGLSDLEQQQFALEATSVALQGTAQVVRGGSIAAYLIPTVFGLADGDFDPGDAASQGANIMEIAANVLSQQAALATTQAQYQRRAEDWQLQKVLAQADIQQIQDQLQAAQIQVQIAQAEIAVLEKNISQVQEVESFLKTKFTNADLYQWMVGKLSALYFQAYQLAYNLALSAERAWQFERGHDQSFINPGYWDDLHKGLLAGEALMLDLQSMEKAYMDQNARRFEIVKTISLKALDPAAFNNLKTGGICSFDLDEKLFDRDYPGHYCRQIKSVSISIPAVLGPYQDIHATVTQTSNKTVLKPNESIVKYLLGKGERPSDGALRFDARADQQIALSQGVNDSGLFELNFYDERYLPFEGTGAVSSWQLEIHDLTQDNPDTTLAQQLKNSLTDVIIQLRYTAIPGNNQFKKDVRKALGNGK